ncbi:hypothetical protein AGMMS50229_09650 [Campylobacterota bacterium]|nr:hypothetical protein AGMMS50229_09650 [Campylobacterota bacterium]
MSLLQVRDFPADIYEHISLIARKERRTIAQQTIVLLEKGLGLSESGRERRRRLIAKCSARTIAPSAKEVDAAALVREDRSR